MTRPAAPEPPPTSCDICSDRQLCIRLGYCSFCGQMPESETPEVDAAEFFAGNIHRSEFSTGAMVVKVKLARSLERRLSLAQTEIKGHMRVEDDLQMRIAELEKDAARYNVLRHPGFADFGVVNKDMTGVIEGEELDAICDAALKSRA